MIEYYAVTDVAAEKRLDNVTRIVEAYRISSRTQSGPTGSIPGHQSASVSAAAVSSGSRSGVVRRPSSTE